MSAPSHGHGAPAVAPASTATLTPASSCASWTAIDPNAPVIERLHAFMARYALSEAAVALDLEWPVERLHKLLTTDPRKLKISTEVERDLETVLGTYMLRLASQKMKESLRKSLTPIDASLRRSAMHLHSRRDPQERQSIVKYKSPACPEQVSPGAARKRRREASTTAVTSAVFPRAMPCADSLCPVRIDVDVDGVRFQDVLLVDASSTTVSPEELAAQLAKDEEFSDPMRDAIAESIRRQLVLFRAGISTPVHSGPASTIRPIVIDIVIDGLAVKDQFEWDIADASNDPDQFAELLCADMKLPAAFRVPLAQSIHEQVTAHRFAAIYPWTGTNLSGIASSSNGKQGSVGCIMNLTSDLNDPIRHPSDTALWQPAISQLGPDELQYLSTKWRTLRGPVSRKINTSTPTAASRALKRSHSKAHRDLKGPRSINAFLMFCQAHKDIGVRGKKRVSAAETRKIMGDMWRKCTDEEKEQYAQMAEVENEKRRREYIFDIRDKAIGEWEDDEARRRGLVASSVLDLSTEHCRGLLLANYMNERHEVDSHRRVRSNDQSWVE